MIKVAQFGEGNFLRAFVDIYFQTLNEEKVNQYSVDIFKPAPFGTLDKFVKQNNRYHVVLRGMKDGKTIEDPYKINVLNSVTSPFEDYDYFLKVSEDKDLKLIVSNTTEAGIAFNEKDDIDGFETITYPAKLTKFLYHRFKNNLPGVYILPVELIENNADELYRCVDRYISLWNLGSDFKKWNDNENYYCNTLVDRIVSGHPRDEETLNHLFSIVNEKDDLLVVGEPFGLWVIQDKGEINKYIKEGFHNINVILAKDISYYKKRKVRVLNGSHTNLVPISLYKDKVTVYDTMMDKKLSKFVQDTLDNDIIPFVSNDVNKTKEFANEVHDRFMNPFLNHQLTSIALNSISKWKARDLPSFLDYYRVNKSIPKYLTIGFAYLVYLYQNIYVKDGIHYVDLPSRTIEVKDEEKYLTYFASHNLNDFIKDESIWGVDLTSFNGFEKTISNFIDTLSKGGDLLD